MSFNSIDFGSVSAAGSGGPPKQRGYFKVRLVDAEHRTTSKGADRIIFSTEVVEGPEAGCVIKDGFNFPHRLQADPTLAFWKQFMESFGVKPQDMWGFIIKSSLAGGMPKSNFDSLSADDQKALKKVKSTELPSLTGFCRYQPKQDGGWSKVDWFKEARWSSLSSLETNHTTPKPAAPKAQENGNDDGILDEILSL